MKIRNPKQQKFPKRKAQNPGMKETLKAKNQGNPKQISQTVKRRRKTGEDLCGRLRRCGKAGSFLFGRGKPGVSGNRGCGRISSGSGTEIY